MKFVQDDIIAVIPHRPPFLLVDRVVDVEFGRRGVGIREIRPADDFIAAYLPGEGVMPRTLFVEALAQTAAFVVAGRKLLPEAQLEKHPTIGYLVRIADFEFSGDAKLGDTLRLSVELISSLGNIYKFGGTALVAGREICKGNLTFSVY